jgi:hypothetical protein
MIWLLELIRELLLFLAPFLALVLVGGGLMLSRPRRDTGQRLVLAGLASTAAVIVMGGLLVFAASRR